MAFFQSRSIQNGHMLKCKTDESLQCFPSALFPFSAHKCLLPQNPLWNLIRLQSLHNVWRWAQINFLQLSCYGKSFIGTDVLQGPARENSWKINMVKYLMLSCSNLQGFITFKLSVALKQLEHFPSFGLTVASWTQYVVALISLHIL